MAEQAGGEEGGSRCTLEDHATRIDLRWDQSSDDCIRCLGSSPCLSSRMPMQACKTAEKERPTHCDESHEPEGLAIPDELSHGRVELELGRCSGSVGSCPEARDRERPRLARDSTEEAHDRWGPSSTAAGCLQTSNGPRLRRKRSEKAIHCSYHTRQKNNTPHLSLCTPLVTPFVDEKHTVKLARFFVPKCRL
jgi:hypothetical protein